MDRYDEHVLAPAVNRIACDARLETAALDEKKGKSSRLFGTGAAPKRMFSPNVSAKEEEHVRAGHTCQRVVLTHC